MIRDVQNIWEQSTLSSAQLAELGCDSSATQRLVALGALTVDRSNDLRANFVGIAASGKTNLQFIPKYLKSSKDTAISTEMALVVRALRKYRRTVDYRHPDAYFLRPLTSGNALSGFALADALLSDYLAYGVYRPKIAQRKLNGKGSVDWTRTVSQTTPIFSGRTPVYADLVNRVSLVDSSHWVTRLHFRAIKEASTRFGRLLGFQPLSLDHELVSPLTSLPSRSFIKATLQKELSSVYSDRSIHLVRLLQSWYLEARGSDRKSLSLYGVRSFHTVWEAICGALFSNRFQEYSEFIPRPEWKSISGHREVAATLVPDIVTLVNQFGRKTFLLLDAKYYLAVMPPNLANQPGIADITKQLFYEQALRPTLQQKGFNNVINGFLFPKQGGDLFDFAGTVVLPDVEGGPISIFYVNAREATQRYVGSNPLTSDELSAFIDSASEP